MSQCSFIVSLMPMDVMDKVKVEENGDLVYEEFHDIGNGKTVVTSVATGSSQGMIFSFDWGAADSFADSVKDILESYITDYMD